MRFIKAQQAKSGSSYTLMMAAIVTITCKKAKGRAVP
jgi:hypothetical protein